MNKDIGIYIHTPFCTSKCYYCDFVSFPNMETSIERYIDSVCSEILQNAEILSEYNIATVYFGGGTPSYIDSKYILKIMDTLRLFFKPEYGEKREITIEINPGSITEDKLKDYVNSGINRVSIGLQSTYDEILKKIGRKHTFTDFENLLSLCKKVNISNISLDLIYPLPGLSLNMFNESLIKIMDMVSKYDIKHISIYNLEIHEGTKLEFLLKEGYETLVDEDEEMEMKRLIEKVLTKNCFLNYEISNFALKGYESKHNLNYWNQGEYLGFGVNSSSFFGGTRYTNTENLKTYIDSIENGTISIKEKDELDKLDLMKEYIILKFRLADGFNVDDFKKRYKVDINDLFKNEIDKLIELKLIVKDKNNIKLTEKGKDLANIVWQEFV